MEERICLASLGISGRIGLLMVWEEARRVIQDGVPTVRYTVPS